MARVPLSVVGAIVRRHDPERYFTALFAPAGRREALFTLYAFNHELARAREAVREPFAALIRLQWWREVVEGTRSRVQVGGHDVAGAVGGALAAGSLDRGDLLAMVEAREAEAEPMETLGGFEAYVRGTAGGLMVAAGRILGMAAPEMLRDWGAAYGMAGVLRSVPALARQGRCVLPLDMLRAAGLSEGAVVAEPGTVGLVGVRSRLAEIGREWLATPVVVPRPALAAALPAVFARCGLRAGLGDGSVVADCNPLFGRSAVIWAWIRARP